MNPIAQSIFHQYGLNSPPNADQPNVVGSRKDGPATELSVTAPIDHRDPFGRIIGQRIAVSFLREICDGIRHGAHPHPLLFLGRSGHGKSETSKAFAESLGVDFVRIDCGPELKSEHVVEQLMKLQALSVVFVDEFQSMRKRVQEIMYGAIDSQTVPKSDGRRLDRCSPPVTISPFILIGATNEPGKLLPAMRNRMVSVVLEEYSEVDLQAIARQKARLCFLDLTDQAVDLVVRASGGSPRNIVQILRSIECTSASWRFGDRTARGCEAGASAGAEEEGGCTSGPMLPDSVATSSLMGESLGQLLDTQHMQTADQYRSSIPDELVERALTWMGLDKAGLDATSRTILATIAQHGRATADLIATVLGLDIAYARERLADIRARQLVNAAPGRGWVLTDTGSKLVAELDI